MVSARCPAPALALLAWMVAGCGDPGACSSGAHCAADEVCRYGRCSSADAGPRDGGSAPRDAGLRPDAGEVCDPACAPGEACVDLGCVGDCRLVGALPCAVPRVCGLVSGTCVTPGEECTLAGEFVSCGAVEFPATCGPGARCEAERCVAAAGCADVVCNALGVCLGVGCGGGTELGAVRDVALAPIADVAPGATLAASASIEGEVGCARSATFELRRELSLLTPAFNDDTIWEIDLGTGARTAHATGLGSIQGIANDARGTVYVVDATCRVGRVIGAPGARTLEPVGTAPGGCSRMAVGPDGALYVAGGLEVNRIDLFAGGTELFATLTTASSPCLSPFLTGLAFDEDGALYLAEHWPSVHRIAPGGGTETVFATAPTDGIACGDVPWNEGIAFDAAGRLHVGVFPENDQAGMIWSAPAGGGAGMRLLGLPEIAAAVPETRHAGIHGVSFGLDGTLYFTNQNTSGPTLEPLGQVLARAPDGTLRLLASGLNFDWPRGYDGDVLVRTEVVSERTVAVDESGRATAMLVAPSTPGPFVVRVLVTDPGSGRIVAATRAAHVR